jgi:hypothetical protein
LVTSKFEFRVRVLIKEKSMLSLKTPQRFSVLTEKENFKTKTPGTILKAGASKLNTLKSKDGRKMVGLDKSISARVGLGEVTNGTPARLAKNMTSAQKSFTSRSKGISVWNDETQSMKFAPGVSPLTQNAKSKLKASSKLANVLNEVIEMEYCHPSTQHLLNYNAPEEVLDFSEIDFETKFRDIKTADRQIFEEIQNGHVDIFALEPLDDLQMAQPDLFAMDFQFDDEAFNNLCK